MQPAVPPPKGARIARPVQLALKPGWRYDERHAVFVDAAGETFEPRGLPPGSHIVYTVTGPPRPAAKPFSNAERDLQRYMHVIVPLSRSPEEQLPTVRSWPCVEDAQVAPEVSLPGPPGPDITRP